MLYVKCKIKYSTNFALSEVKMLFVCPKCKEQLNIAENGSAFCQNGHSYDRSRKGYYNLFLTNKGGVHGDNKMMVEARRAFLDGDFYKPLAVGIAEKVKAYAKKGGAVLDIGCGEGYYTDYVEKALSARDGESNVYGFDISKDAVARAIRRNPKMNIAVAGAYDMPIAGESVDVAINLFAPLALTETHRILKPDGHFIMAIPGVEHLFGLKELLYKNPYKNTVNEPELEGFELVSSTPVSYKLMLNRNEDIRNLFRMTPYAYRTPEDACKLIEELPYLETSIDFIIFVYKKQQNTAFFGEMPRVYI